MSDRIAYMPLNTYPEAAPDAAIRAAMGLAGALGCRLQVSTFAVSIPQVASPMAGFLIDVEGMARATADLDETLDDICAEVEAALAADVTLGGKAKVLYLTGIDDPEQSDEGDQPTGLVRLNFRVQYRTLNTTPTATA